MQVVQYQIYSICTQYFSITGPSVACQNVPIRTKCVCVGGGGGLRNGYGDNLAQSESTSRTEPQGLYKELVKTGIIFSHNCTRNFLTNSFP